MTSKKVKMKAIHITKSGGPEVLQVQETPKPTPGTQIAQEVQKNIWPLFHSKQIHPVIYKTFPLEEAGEAHRLMESSDHIGKILLTMDCQ
jgi:NADPH:quinone reductase-like Zn-dependent oxidoreductase